uniref:Uncharacterized protein n=1 Tax=Chromera velia CCMP2878 TaxID=1169474 RepID=A0A0G4GEI9_9ALVE|eukprot:Cvel_21520.t1-p1 / transcript=Cvel_21520.t1 / gene=Cvel_21520 / organism=Chromera_velia_CCMP2878 / gene_product=hypothetical protein / transcript_product=hypothetical protein / location=Cvel_scaffold2026:6492-10160(+) / protein_length=505 / sequence_SO=supercontig / SO=protein_coding / is_pseudo=false
MIRSCMSDLSLLRLRSDHWPLALASIGCLNHDVSLPQQPRCDPFALLRPPPPPAEIVEMRKVLEQAVLSGEERDEDVRKEWKIYDWFKSSNLWSDMRKPFVYRAEHLLSLAVARQSYAVSFLFEAWGDEWDPLLGLPEKVALAAKFGPLSLLERFLKEVKSHRRRQTGNTEGTNDSLLFKDLAQCAHYGILHSAFCLSALSFPVSAAPVNLLWPVSDGAFNVEEGRQGIYQWALPKGNLLSAFPSLGASAESRTAEAASLFNGTRLQEPEDGVRHRKEELEKRLVRLVKSPTFYPPAVTNYGGEHCMWDWLGNVKDGDRWTGRRSAPRWVSSDTSRQLLSCAVELQQEEVLGPGRALNVLRAIRESGELASQMAIVAIRHDEKMRSAFHWTRAFACPVMCKQELNHGAGSVIPEHEKGAFILHMNPKEHTPGISSENRGVGDICECGGALPIHIAAYRSNVEAMKVLVEYGADIFKKDSNSRNVLHYIDLSPHANVSRQAPRQTA